MACTCLAYRLVEEHLLLIYHVSSCRLWAIALTTSMTDCGLIIFMDIYRYLLLKRYLQGCYQWYDSIALHGIEMHSKANAELVKQNVLSINRGPSQLL